MLTLNQLSGFGVNRVYQPASMVFNGTDEHLTRTLSTSGASTTIFTYSVWVKTAAYVTNSSRIANIVSSLGANSFLVITALTGTLDFLCEQGEAGTGEWSVGGTGTDAPTGTWFHYVVRYDSSQGVAAERLRIYRNGTELPHDGGTVNPTLNEVHRLFQNGRIHLIGRRNDSSSTVFFNGKLAFIDVLEGVSADPTAFAFNNGGTWTRKPYVGARGTYGFSIDGTVGLGLDVSGNGQNFAPSNMDASNLDFADLPPWVA